PNTITVDSASGGLALVTTYGYDGIGNQTSVDGPRTDVADTITITYDNERRATRVTNGLGKISETAYDEIGQPVRIAAQQDSRWMVSRKSYSYSGKVTSAWGPAICPDISGSGPDPTCPSAAAPVPVTGYTYDSLDRLSLTTVNLQASEGGNRVTKNDYYANGQLKDIQKAHGTGAAQFYATYTYAPYTGKVATVADAKSNHTTYTYDDDYRLAKVQYPVPTSANNAPSSTTDYEQYTYDGNDNVVSVKKRNGQSITIGFDNLNRPISRTYPA